MPRRPILETGRVDARRATNHRWPAGRGGRLTRAVGALLLASVHARALEANEWKNRQSLAIDGPGVIKFVLPPATLDRARPGLEDLRLLDPAGRELPFVVERAAPAAPVANRPLKSFRATLVGTVTQIVVETGNAGPLAALTLHTPAPSFLKAARLEVSADGEKWDLVQPGLPVFRQFGAEHLRLDLERRTASHVRITIDDARTPPVPFTGATLWPAPVIRPAVTTPLAVRLAGRDEYAGESVLTLDLGAQNVPLAALEFVTADPLFARSLTITVRELRNDAAVERTLASGSIFRIAADGLTPSARLDVPLEIVAPSRELLVHIVNHDSPTLPIEEVRAQQRPVWLVFRATDPGTYSLLTGNPDAAAPRYDLASLASALRETPPSSLVPGPVELVPGYRRADALGDTPLLGAALDPAPWSYRKQVRLNASGVHQLELDLDVLAHAQSGLADLRLVRDGLQVPYLLERPALSRTTELTLRAAGDPQRPRLSRWEIRLPRANLPLTQLTLSSPTALFQRHLRLLEKIVDDRSGSRERVLAEADWSHQPGNDRPLVMALPVPPATDALQLETDNGDNPPLVLAAVQAAYPVARLLFKTEFGPLALFYGQREAGAPHYDLNLVAAQILAAEKNAATLAAEEKAQRDGWGAGALAGARGGILFWGALALVVTVLLLVVAKLLPKPPTPAG